MTNADVKIWLLWLLIFAAINAVLFWAGWSGWVDGCTNWSKVLGID